jgi:putative transposase
MQEVAEKNRDNQVETIEEAVLGACTPHEALEQLIGEVRQVARRVFITTIQHEFEAFIGAGEYKRSEKRKDHRNGYRTRNLVTEIGTLEDVPIPRSRHGHFLPSLFHRWQRTQRKVVALVGEMFLRGVSTRKIGKLSKALWGKEFSPATVSEFNSHLKEEFLQWMNRPLQKPIRYLYLDGIALKLRRKWISKEMLLSAVGITSEGKKEFLGFVLGGSESSASWEFLLRQLLERGLDPKTLGLVVIDGSLGLKKALALMLPGVAVQRCIVHKLWNVTGHTPYSLRGVVPQELKRIFYAPNEQDARTLFFQFKERWSKEAPKAVECVEKDIEELLSFYSLPFRHWTLIRTTNVIERAFKEFRRRVKIMETFPTEESCQRIMLRWRRC